MIIYLYVKQHSITGLKYFGKTTNPDPCKYKGSGKYWINHCNKHGWHYVDTIQIWEFEDSESCLQFSEKFSKDNNIVESKSWANLTDETLQGIAKGTKLPPNSQETKELKRKSMKGRSPWNKGIKGTGPKGGHIAWNRGKKLETRYCQACDKHVSYNNFARWHKNCNHLAKIT